MADNNVITRIYKADDPRIIDINRKEILRYSGYMGIDMVDEALDELLDQVISEGRNAFSYKVCYLKSQKLPFRHNSKALAKCLYGSDETVMFAATVGLDVDRLIARYQKLSEVKALLLQAFGTERVEALCDAFCIEFSEVCKEAGRSCTPRFSPGYGDLPLDIQKDFFEILNPGKHIGVSLSDSLLMSPSKSVTAVFGIKKDADQPALSTTDKCISCNNTECEIRL